MADISRILTDWPYEAERVSVRLVHGDDGREKIQMRIDLGLMQMELDGRPDGQHVFDSPTWLDFYEREQQAHELANPDGSPYSLSGEQCQNLLREGIQFYHRYLSFWHLALYELCARDTARNLRLFAFVRRFAAHERDRLQFDQWRPYVTMMHARSIAQPLVAANRRAEAIAAIDEGIAAIEQFLEDYDQSVRSAQVSELTFLRRWKAELKAGKKKAKASVAEDATEGTTPEATGMGGAAMDGNPPASEHRLRLQRELERAIAAERYEEAARLRDQIRDLLAHDKNAPPLAE